LCADGQASKLCLMTRGCATAEGTDLVLDACAAACLASAAPKFTLHHKGGNCRAPSI
jgi:hypothetical protein